MENLFKSLEIRLWNLVLKVGKRGRTRKEAVAPPSRFAPDEIRLEFLAQSQEQPIEAVPIAEILSQPTDKEALSSQPTIKVIARPTQEAIYSGATIPTKTVKQKIKQAEAVMLVVSSFLGLIIGVLIAFFIK
jgi:hypothetical protein